MLTEAADTAPATENTPPKRRLTAERIALAALAAVYLLVTGGYALVTPYGEAPDEYAHVAYIEHIVKYGTLPEVSPRSETYDAFQPPLYYLLGAGVVAIGKTVTGRSLSSGIAPALNPNPDFGKLRKPTGRSALIYIPEARWPAWVYVLRAMSALMGLGVVLLTYATARTLAPPPAPALVPLLAAAFAALIPGANFIHSSVSNESLADLVAAWLVLLAARHVALPYNRARPLWLGLALGVGLLSKGSSLALLVVVLWALWVRRRKSERGWLRDAALAVGVAALVAGWFYVYQWATYGDPLANAAMRVVIPPNSTWSLTDFFWVQHPFRWYLWSSFWGVFGWQIIYLPDWVYYLFAVLVALAVVGGVALFARRALNAAQARLCLLFLGMTALEYGVLVQWSTYLIAWQGRLLYPALSSICVLLALGLGGLFLGRSAVSGGAVAQAWRARAGYGFSAALAVALLALNVYSIVWVIYPVLNHP